MAFCWVAPLCGDTPREWLSLSVPPPPPSAPQVRTSAQDGCPPAARQPPVMPCPLLQSRPAGREVVARFKKEGQMVSMQC